MERQSYRILQYEGTDGEPVLAIHMVVYDEEGHLQGWGDEPIARGSTVEELLAELEAIRDAAFQPIIDMRDPKWDTERPTGR